MSAGLLLASPASHAADLPPLILARAGESNAASAPLQLYLEVSLNHTAYGTPQPFELREGRLFASVATLRQLGFVLDGRGEAESLAPDSLPGVAVRYDASLQRVAIDAPLSLLSLATTRLNAPGTDIPTASASPGLLFNYDLYSSRDDHSDSTSAFAELRVFGMGRGVFSQTAVTRSQRSEDEPRRTDSVRLDSSWRWSSPASMLSVSVGDVISGQLDWTRPLRLGGVRIGRDFGLQPYRITTPLPTFVGEVAVPSAVDLYVNGIRQYSGELPPGPFQLATIPGITGAGNAQLVVTDAFGRTRQLDFPFYAAQQLLAKGLSDWSLSLGLAREDYALRSFAYGSEPLASADLRYGVSDSFTVEAHAEGGDSVVNGGLGAVWLLGGAGVFSASLAHGQDRNDSGWLYAAAYNWSNGRFNISADTQRTHGEYRDVASRYGQAPARVSERAVASWNDTRLGSLGLSYVRLIYRDETPARYGSATWSRNFKSGASLSLSYNQNLDRSEDRNLYLGFSMNFDRQLQLSASLQRNRGRDQAVLDLSRPLPGDGGFGWRLQARGGDGEEGGLAEAGWLTSYGRYSLGFARQGDVDYGYASASGSLVWMGGHVFAARNVSDAFAVVSTGRADVPVLLENRPIGRTDRDGMLLVTPLNAWQRNRIAIDPMELPADLRLDRVEVQATPQDRSGTLVRFGIEQVRAAVLVLQDDRGEALPVGSRVHLDSDSNSGASAVVGYDGETYLDTLQELNTVRVETPDGPCSVRFAYPAGGGVPRIGPLICQRQVSP
ncbi:type VII secretion system (T7SS), usher family protein [Lysobacter antibioticus]|uniref:Type VII secretion system (T7SS), usher family protein n=2 Tax=Lysobacter antibioticus TaxID=84531 RepID=A0A0S2F3Y9_LYSAN|nr:type VII secretion system (T7SS), usher family protein [Lysobacter antibioticus]